LPVGNCVSWWREGDNGYTCDIEDSGIFTRERALQIIRDRPDLDKAYAVPDIIVLGRLHVDWQQMRELKPLTVERTPSDEATAPGEAKP
jgi:hypothetical protein